MLKQVLALGLMSTAFGLISLPAKAQDTAIIQRSTTDVYIEGEGNDAVQSVTQVNHTRRVNGRRGGSTATVQDAYSGAVILGEDNGVYQDQTQISIEEEVNRRPRNRRGRRGRDVYIRQR